MSWLQFSTIRKAWERIKRRIHHWYFQPYFCRTQLEAESENKVAELTVQQLFDMGYAIGCAVDCLINHLKDKEEA